MNVRIPGNAARAASSPLRLIAVSAAALALAACGNSTAAPSTVGAAGSAGASGDITVTTWGNNQDVASIKDAAAGFSKASPGIHVNIVTGDCGVDYAACKKLVAGKNMPDVLVAGTWNYFQMAKDGILADLTPALKADGIAKTDFTPVVINALSDKSTGDLYGLPMGYNVQSLFYNTDMFKKAGLPNPPADGNYTYDDLRQWATKLTLDKNGNNAQSPKFDPKNIVQWGYANLAASSPPIEQGYDPILAAFGGGVLSGESRNQCVVDSPGTIAGMQWLQDIMWKDHTAITPQLHQETPGYLRWAQGHVAMQQGSHEQVGVAKSTTPSLKFDMAALPKGPKGSATLIQSHVWAVYKGSKNVSAATKFVEYMATQGSGKQMGLIPAYKDKALGPDFAQAPGEPSNLVAAQITPASWPLNYVNIDPSTVWAAISGQDGFGPAFEDIVSNRKTAQAALTGLCAKTINPIIAKQQ